MAHSHDWDDNEQWAPVADLMAALMLIFMFIAVVYVRTVVMSATELAGVETYRGECEEIYRELKDEFDEDFEKWEAKLGKDLAIRFYNPHVLFLKTSTKITPAFKDILSDFFPRYARKLFPYHRDKKDIKEIRIEGHTSSEWEGETDEKKAYMENMKLSQNRAYATLEYILQLPSAQSYDKWMRPLITVNGLSSNRLVNKEGLLIVKHGGKENKKMSRRVEIRLLISSCDKGEKK